jgi:hypothetical protein
MLGKAKHQEFENFAWKKQGCKSEFRKEFKKWIFF